MAIRMLAFLLCAPTLALCYESERAMNNLAAEFSECAAYNILISAAPLSSEEAKKNYLEVGKRLLALSVELTSEKVAFARTEIATKMMRHEIENNWSNIAIIINKYAYPCKELAENPTARLRYWLDKKD